MAKASLDAIRRADAIWKELLTGYEPPYINPGIEQGLQEFAELRGRELVGVNLLD